MPIATAKRDISTAMTRHLGRTPRPWPSELGNYQGYGHNERKRAHEKLRVRLKDLVLGVCRSNWQARRERRYVRVHDGHGNESIQGPCDHPGFDGMRNRSLHLVPRRVLGESGINAISVTAAPNSGMGGF
jgi:hypothetical protein